MTSVYDAAGGHDGLLRLAHAWHTRALADEVVAHAFSRGHHPDHTGRLAAYWSEALGGPPLFSSAVGDETTVVRLHSGNGAHEDMDRRAIAAFAAALTDVAMPAPVARVLLDYFTWTTTHSLTRYPDSAADVPPGLAIPHWSWTGLQNPGV